MQCARAEAEVDIAAKAAVGIQLQSHDFPLGQTERSNRKKPTGEVPSPEFRSEQTIRTQCRDIAKGILNSWLRSAHDLDCL